MDILQYHSKKIKYFLGLIYNKVFEYQKQTQHGGFGLGFWWESDMLTEICKDLRVTCEILEQKKRYHIPFIDLMHL